MFCFAVDQKITEIMRQTKGFLQKKNYKRKVLISQLAYGKKSYPSFLDRLEDLSKQTTEPEAKVENLDYLIPLLKTAEKNESVRELRDQIEKEIQKQSLDLKELFSRKAKEQKSELEQKISSLKNFLFKNPSEELFILFYVQQILLGKELSFNYINSFVPKLLEKNLFSPSKEEEVTVKIQTLIDKKHYFACYDLLKILSSYSPEILQTALNMRETLLNLFQFLAENEEYIILAQLVFECKELCKALNINWSSLKISDSLLNLCAQEEEESSYDDIDITALNNED